MKTDKKKFRMKNKLSSIIFLFLLVIAIISAIQINSAFANPDTLYMRNNETLGTSQTNAVDSVFIYSGINVVNIDIGIRIFKYDGETETEIYTSGTPVAVASSSSEGLISATYTVTNLTINSYLRIKVYGRRRGESYSLLQTFTSQKQYKKIVASEWTVYYYLYLYRDYGQGTCSYYFRYGVSTANSRITGFESEFPSNQIIFPSTSTLQFQNDINKTVKLHVLNGVLNSMINTISLYESGGYFSFTALNDIQIEIIYEGVNIVQVSGDQGHEQRSIDSGTVITVNKGDNVRIGWTTTLEIWLPVTLALGIAGFGMLVASPTYTFYKIKQREYSSAFCWGFLMFIIGIGLVIVWLWG